MPMINNYSRMSNSPRHSVLSEPSFITKSEEAVIKASEEEKREHKFDEKFKGSWKTLTMLNFRKGPSMSDGVIRVIKKDEKLRCEGYYNESTDGTIWLEVKHNGEIGYVMKTYLRR